MKTLALLVVLVASLGLPKIGSAQVPGDLDRSFSDDGMLVTDFSGITSSAVGNAVAVLSDGRIFVAGSAQSGGTGHFSMACYNSEGNLEASFGRGGKMTMNLADGNEEINYGLAVQSGDKIIVAGSSNFSFNVARFNPDGGLDTTFGPLRNGKVSINMGGPARVYDVSLQSDDKILVAGYTYWRRSLAYALTVVRLNPDGSSDTTFDGDGIAFIFGDLTATISADPVAVAVQPDGKIVLAGTVHSGAPADNNFLLVRLNGNGSLDNSFDADGRVVTHVSGDQSRDLLVQPDGKIVLVGTIGGADPRVIDLLRYNSSGALDATFGSNHDGVVTTDFGSPRRADRAEAVAALLQPDGKIVVVGTTIIDGLSLEDFLVIRYNPDGSLDTGFSGDGVQVTSLGEVDEATGVALQPDGKILVAGFSCENHHYPDNCRFAMARYLGGPLDRPDGGPDRRHRRAPTGCTGIRQLDWFKKNCPPIWYDPRRHWIP